MNAIGDNPTFFPEDDVVLHGSFHGQPLALAIDHGKVALAEIALFSNAASRGSSIPRRTAGCRRS